MSAKLTIGNRVRVTARNRMHGYRTGDRGIVLWGPSLPDAAGELFYLVVMEKDANGNAVVFNSDEIEPDVKEAAPGHPAALTPDQTDARANYKQA